MACRALLLWEVGVRLCGRGGVKSARGREATELHSLGVNKYKLACMHTRTPSIITQEVRRCGNFSELGEREAQHSP